MFSNLLRETQLSLWARHLVMRPRLDMRGGIKAQSFAFLASFFSVYGYRAAKRPVFCFLNHLWTSFSTGIFYSTAFGESSMLLDNTTANKMRAKHD